MKKLIEENGKFKLEEINLKRIKDLIDKNNLENLRRSLQDIAIIMADDGYDFKEFEQFIKIYLNEKKVLF